MGKTTSLFVYDDTKGSGECRSCHAPIEWFEMVGSGKRHPFNAGVVYLATKLEETTRRLIGIISSDDSHFASCPQSKQWSHK